MSHQVPQKPDCPPQIRIAGAPKLGVLAGVVWIGLAAFAPLPAFLLSQAPLAAAAADSPERQTGDVTPSPSEGSSQRTLREILTFIEREHGISIVMDRDLIDAGTSAIDPAGLPPDVALRQALNGFDLFFHYGPSRTTGEMELKRVWVFADDQGRSMEVIARPAEPAAPAGGSEAQPPIEALGEPAVTNGDPEGALRWALADPDDNVRLQALNVAQANGFPLPVGTIEMLLSMDPSEIVRLTALEALSLNPDIDPQRLQALLLEQAKRDPSPMVREHAAALLNSFSPPAPDAQTEPALGSVPSEVPAETQMDPQDATGSDSDSTDARPQ